MATTKTPAKARKTRKTPAKAKSVEAQIEELFGSLDADTQAKIAEKTMKRDAKNAVAKKVRADKKAETNEPGLNPCELTEGEKAAKIKAKCCFVTVKKVGDKTETYRHVGMIVAPAEKAPYRISIATGGLYRISGDTATDRDRLIRQTVDKAKNTPEIADWLLKQAGFTK